MKHVEEFVVQDIEFKGQENSGTALKQQQRLSTALLYPLEKGHTNVYYMTLMMIVTLLDSLVVQLAIATNGAIDISRSKFETNKADWGGAIAAEQYSIINMRGNVLLITMPPMDEYYILTAALLQ